MSKRRMKYHSNNNEISYYNFLHSMKDKIVTVYRGGPESKQGKLAAVKSDYIALQVEKKIIYYQLEHVKSITEDTNNNTTTLETEEMADADDFHSLIGQLTNQFVQLNQGGPESKKGCLVWLGDDYAALNTNEDGVVYFNIHHIKSISKHEPDLKMEEQTPADVLEADYLSEVFKSLTHKWVSINRGGPEAIEGILVDNADGHYTLVKNQEVLRIYPFHIKSISLGPKGSYKKEDKKKEHDDQEDNKDSDQKQEEVYSSSLRSSKPYRSSKSSKRSPGSSGHQSSKSHHSSGSKSSSKSSKRSPGSSGHQSSKSHHSSGSKSSSKSSKRSPGSSGYQSSKSHHSSGSKSSSKSSKRSPRSSDYQSSKSSGFYGSSSSFESSGGQKEEYSYETIVKTIDYHWKRKF